MKGGGGVRLFLVCHILSTLQLWNFTYYNTKGTGRRKAFILHKEVGEEKGGGFFFLSFLLYLGRKGNRARVWQEPKTVDKEPECKGMHISTNCVDFFVPWYKLYLKQWNVKWFDRTLKKSTHPHSFPLSKTRLLNSVCWITLRKK